MISIGVIAIGSRIMKDDGIGIRVAEAIKEKETICKGNIDIVIAETDFEYGIEEAKAYDYIVILDAMISGRAPGVLTKLSLGDAGGVKKEHVSQHNLSLIDIIRKTRGSGSFIGIEAEEIDFGCELSNTLKGKFKDICYQVEKEILGIKEGLKDA